MALRSTCWAPLLRPWRQLEKASTGRGGQEKQRFDGSRVVFQSHAAFQRFLTASSSFASVDATIDEEGDDDNDSEVVVSQHSTKFPQGEPLKEPPFTSLHKSTKTTISPVTLNQEKQEATRLTDQLLERTKRIMTYKQGSHDKNESLIPSTLQNHQYQYQHQHHRHTIAFSGGIDSSLVAALVHHCSLDLNETTASYSSSKGQLQTVPPLPRHHHSVQCIMGVSAAVPVEQISAAEAVAAAIGIDFVTVPTHEGTVPMYIENNGQACLACKTELYGVLQAIASHTMTHQDREGDSSNDPTTIRRNLLYNGTNADDLRDVTRLGLVAAAQFDVQSPIDILTKQQVRLVARHAFCLPNWNVAASPCLRSRLALGVPATTLHLKRIAQAERFVRRQLEMYGSGGDDGYASANQTANASTVASTLSQHPQTEDPTTLDTSSSSIFTPSANLRVRLLANQQARVEVDDGPLLDATRALWQQYQRQWNDVFLHQLQFASVTIAPFKSGSVSTTMSQTNTKTVVSP